MSFFHYNAIYMDTVLLKNFLLLAQTKNFTKAADKLCRSQSAISLQIAKLEGLVGKSLFIRDHRKLVLTPAGEEFIGYARRMVAIEDELMNHFHKPAIKGRVTFGTPEDLATAYLPDILGAFVESHPQILLNVDCQFTLNLLKGFDAHHYDLVLIKQDPEHPHPKSKDVWREPLVWVSKRDFPYFNAEEEGIPLVLSPPPCVYRQRAIDTLNREGIRWRIVYTSPSLAGTLAAVKAGLGISILPRKMASKELHIIRELPILKDAQIALLKDENCSEAASALAAHVVNQMIATI